jgi:hypothetical protein
MICFFVWSKYWAKFVGYSIVQTAVKALMLIPEQISLNGLLCLEKGIKFIAADDFDLEDVVS